MVPPDEVTVLTPDSELTDVEVVADEMVEVLLPATDVEVDETEDVVDVGTLDVVVEMSVAADDVEELGGRVVFGSDSAVARITGAAGESLT